MTLSTQLYTNNAKTTTATNVSSSDTTIQVSDGSKFPSPAANQFFLVTLEYGGVIEIVKVTGKSGNNLTGCVRGQEGTTPNGFPAGARLESRATAGMFTGFARKIDRLDELASVDFLDAPNSSNSNTYICSSNDDAGNPVIAVKRGSTNTWRFNTHTITKVAGSIGSVTTTTLTSTAIANNIPNVTAGKYILQFVSGVNIGICRAIVSSSTNTVSWGTPLAITPSAGDQFEIYKSDSSNLSELIAVSGVPVSDPNKIDVNNGTATGILFVNGILKAKGILDVKSAITANTSTTTLDLSTADVFKVTISSNTSFAFNNAPSGTDVYSFTLITVNDATAGRAVSFPSNVKWAGGILPPRTTTANAIDVWTFFTDDAGTTFGGSLAVADMK